MTPEQLASMTDEQIDVAVAEMMGWTVTEEGEYIRAAGDNLKYLKSQSAPDASAASAATALNEMDRKGHGCTDKGRME